MTGIVHVGTSGFAYPDWAPRFYPAGLRGDGLLRHYATRLAACELNNTFYQQPTPAKVAAWLAATPPDFRFAVKAQRGGSFRSLQVDPVASVPWLTDPLPARSASGWARSCSASPDGVQRDDDRLAASWPPGRRPAAHVEFQDPSWHVDEVFAALAGRRRGALHDGAARRRGAARRSAGPGRSSTSGCAATTTRTTSSRRGRHGSSRSSPTASTRSCSSATTRSGAARELALEFAALTARRRPVPAARQPAREPSAGPNATRSVELLGDVVEPMRHGRRDEHDRTRRDVADLVADRDPAGARHDVVDLVLGVRLLAIRLPGGEDVQPDAQVRDRDELQVRPVAGRLGGGREVGELVRIHRRSLAVGNRLRPAGRSDRA